MKSKPEQKQSVASMINLGLRSTSKAVANYTAAALKKSETPKLGAAQGLDARKSREQQHG